MQQIKPCSLCRLIHQRPLQQILSNRYIEQTKFYSICSQGHIMCRSCIMRLEDRSGFMQNCPLGTNVHQCFEQFAECLKVHTDGYLNLLLKKECNSLQRQIGKKKQKIASLRQSRQNNRRSHRSPRQINNSLQAININEINLQTNEDMTVQQIQQQIARLKQQIVSHSSSHWNALLILDVILSIIFFVGMILQAIFVIKSLLEGKDSHRVLIIYLLAFGIMLFTFLSTAAHQAFKLYHKIGCFYIPIIFINIIILPLAIPFSVIINTLEIIKSTTYQQCFIIPRAFPWSAKINYSIIIIKICLYWAFLCSRHLAFSNDFELAVFIWSFLECAALILINVRYNQNLQQRMKKDQNKSKNKKKPTQRLE